MKTQEITETNVQAIGFVFLKEYSHDQYFTKVFQNGILQVDFTYEDKQLINVDLSIEEAQCLPISIEQLHQLRIILGTPTIEVCDHEWKITHSGYCKDCVKCGRKE